MIEISALFLLLTRQQPMCDRSSSLRFRARIAALLCPYRMLRRKITKRRIRVTYPSQRIHVWDDDMFLKMFRFRKADFDLFLSAIQLRNKLILYGRKNKKQFYPAELRVMVLLRNLADLWIS